MPGSVLVDSLNNDHLIGSRYATDGVGKQPGNEGFEGYIWSMKIYNYAKTSFGSEIALSVDCPNGCTQCPKGNCGEGSG